MRFAGQAFDVSPHVLREVAGDPRAQHDELAARFFAAAEEGDLEGLEELLTHDVVMKGDGGGKAPAARSAVQKILAAMSERNVVAARDLVGRVRLLEPATAPQIVPVPSVIEQAIVARRVLAISYLDREGRLTQREVEPAGRKAGVKVGSVEELIAKLKDEAGVI